MELDSFKAILLRKADGNNSLHSLIVNIEEDTLVDSVVEALNKMATEGTGRKANGAITSFGQHMDLTDKTQLRDAIGHHLSHYKAALKAHHATPAGPEKAKMRTIADQHLEHVIPLMHLAARTAAHSKGQLAISHPELSPWETNYTTLTRNSKGDGPLRDPKLLNARPSKRAVRTPGSTGMPDYQYLEMPPHPGHPGNAKMPHTGGYPWEEVQVGSPAEIDAKKAYLHIEDVPDKKEYTPHEFDQHPIRAVADTSGSHMTDEASAKYADDVNNWRDSEPHAKWQEKEEKKYEADPQAYETRGQTKPSPFYEGIPLKQQEAHIHDHPVAPKMQQILAQREAEAPKKQSSGGPVTATPPTKRSAQPAVEGTAEKQHPLEPAHRIWKTLSEKDRASMLNVIPGLRAYVAKKGGK